MGNELEGAGNNGLPAPPFSWAKSNVASLQIHECLQNLLFLLTSLFLVEFVGVEVVSLSIIYNSIAKKLNNINNLKEIFQKLYLLSNTCCCMTLLSNSSVV